MLLSAPYDAHFDPEEWALLNDPDGKHDVIAIDVDEFVKARALVQANSGGGKSRLLRRILEQTHGTIQQIVIDVEGEFYTLREKLDMVLAAPAGGDCVATVSTARQLCRMVIELGTSVVIDISELSHLTDLKVPEEQRTDQATFVKLFCEELIAIPRELWHQTMIVIDEAQRFVPQDEDAVSTRAVLDVMTRGRKRGWHPLLACQRLSDLHKSAAAECNNRMIGRTSLDVDISRARKALGMSAKTASDTLPRLKPGEFFCVGPGLTETVTRVRAGAVETTHPEAGAAPAPIPPPPARLRAVLGKLGKLAQVAAKEQAEQVKQTADVDKLRARIAELEAAAKAFEIHRGEVPAWAIDKAQDLEKQNADLQATIYDLEHEAEISSEVLEEMVAVIDSSLTRVDEIAEKLRDDLSEPLLRLRNLYADKVQKSVERADGKLAKEIADTQASWKATEVSRQAVAKANQASRDARVEHDGNLNRMAKTLLTCVAQRGRLTRKKLLVFSGYANSGKIGETIGYLVRMGWMSTPEPGTVEITEAGREVLGPLEPLPTGAKLRAQIRDQLDTMGQKIFDVVCEAYPRSISRKQVLEKTGYANSGKIGETIGHMIAREWMVKTDVGVIAMAKELFQ